MERSIERTYGIPFAEYQARWVAQDGRCAICGDDESVLDRRLVTDHDHATGAVRALLCYRCNLGIGQLRHDTAIIRKAGAYLREGGAIQR